MVSEKFCFKPGLSTWHKPGLGNAEPNLGRFEAEVEVGTRRWDSLAAGGLRLANSFWVISLVELSPEDKVSSLGTGEIAINSGRSAAAGGSWW